MNANIVVSLLTLIFLSIGGIEIASAQTASFCQTLDFPGSLSGTTMAKAVNNSGAVVGVYGTGSYDDGTYANHGFLWANGQYLSIDTPGAVNTYANGINDSGQIVGSFDTGYSASAFLLSAGQFTTIDFPSNGSNTVTVATGINNAGTIVGYYRSSPAYHDHAFVLSQGTFTQVDVPNIVNTDIWSISNNGVAAGWAADGNGTYSFTLQNGQITLLGDFPTGRGTQAQSINSSGTIVGTYAMSVSPYNGSFSYQNGVFSNFSCPDTFSAAASGLNDRGMLVGNYTDSTFTSHGFVTPPVALLDPVPDLISGPTVTTSTEALASNGRAVQGIAADGTSEVVLRIPAATAGEQVTVTLFNDATPPCQSISADDDGALGIPGASGFTQSSITVTATTTSKGVFAFALYRAPVDFFRGNQDTNSVSRDVYLQIQSSSNNALVPLRIIRPLVAMIHGLWDNSEAWNTFAPLTSLTTRDQRFGVLRITYDSLIDPQSLITTDPVYIAVSGLRANSLGFDYNARDVKRQLEKGLTSFKTGQNPANISVSATQADIVAHSMGGDIARTIALQPNYLNDTTLGQGTIHKIISIDTPHFGSSIATNLIISSNRCLRAFLASRQQFTLNSATLSDGTERGAVGDLIDSPQSTALSNIATQMIHQIPTAMIAGIYTRFGDLSTSGRATFFNTVFGCPNDPLANALTPAGWPALFGDQPNDAIVSVNSQQNGQPNSALQMNGFVHSNGTTGLGFSGPSILDPSGAANLVITLLNTSITNTNTFILINP